MKSIINDVDFLYDNDFLSQVMPINSFILGLPNCACISSSSIKTITNDISGFFTVNKSRYTGKICGFNMHDTIVNVNKTWIMTQHHKFLSAQKKIMIFPNDIEENKVILVVGGYYYDGSKLTPSKIVNMDTENNYINLENIRVMFSNCYMAIVHNRIDTFIYDLKLIPFYELPHFLYSDKPENYNNIIESIAKINIPSNLINKCYQEFKSCPFDFTIVKCIGGDLKMANYLKYLFGNTPIYHTEGFDKEGIHDINYTTLKLLYGWLLDLVMHNILPTADTLIENDMNLLEWLHIAEYLNIPIFINLFNEVLLSLN